MFEIMTPYKAYILGLISTDGCIYKYTTSIELQHRDEGVLFNISNIFYDEGYNPKISRTTKKGRVYTRLRIHSKRLAEELCLLGITPRKSYTVPFLSNISYIHEYVRGLIDGDGNIEIRRNNIEITFHSASERLIEGYISYLQSIGIKPKKANRHGGVLRVSVYANEAKTLYSKCYYVKCLSIPRKRDKILSFTKSINPKLWSEEDQKYLKDNLGVLTYPQLAKDLDNSLKFVKMKVLVLKEK